MYDVMTADLNGLIALLRRSITLTWSILGGGSPMQYPLNTEKRKVRISWPALGAKSGCHEAGSTFGGPWTYSQLKEFGARIPRAQTIAVRQTTNLACFVQIPTIAPMLGVRAAASAAAAKPAADACPELHADSPAHHRHESEETPEDHGTQRSDQIIGLALQNSRNDEGQDAEQQRRNEGRSFAQRRDRSQRPTA